MDNHSCKNSTIFIHSGRSTVNHAIVIDELTKRYEEMTAVKDLSMTVEDGEIYGFLGPNGAGKSTTINILMDYARPTSGTVRILNRDPKSDVVEIHKRVGILPDKVSIYEDRTGREHVKLVAETKQVNSDIVGLLERIGLGDAIDQLAGSYSQGMRQRLALAMALVGEPDILILDEPFRGLDPRGIRMIREVVYEENNRGATVFFSSHVLGQVELVCDRIGILHEGTLVTEGPIEQLRSEAPIGPTVELDINGSLNQARRVADTLDVVERITSSDRTLTVHLSKGSNPSTVVDSLQETGIEVTQIDSQPPSIESIFLTHTETTPGEVQ